MIYHSDSSNTRSERVDSDDMRDAGARYHGEDARQRAHDAASNARDTAWQQAQSQYEQKSGFAADQTERLGVVLRRMADEFDRQDQQAFSGYAKKLAGYSDSMSEKLRERDLNSIVKEAQDLGRRQPALVVGGALAAGFVLARFLRTSGRNDANPAASQPSTTPMRSGRDDDVSHMPTR